MIVHMIFDDDLIVVRARAEIPGGGIADVMEEVEPGGGYGLLSYDELRALGEGKQDIPVEE